MVRMLALIQVFLLSTFLSAHENHPMVEVDGRYKLISGKDERITMRLYFETENDKVAAQLKLESVQKVISFVSQTACYEIRGKRGENLFKHDLLHHFELGNIKVHDILVRR